MDIGNILSSLIGIFVGSLISWLSSKWLNRRSKMTEIRLRVTDEICTKILGLRERIYKGNELKEQYSLLLCRYTWELPGVNGVYKSLKNCRGELYKKLEQLEQEFEQFNIYLEVREIVVRDFYKIIRELYDCFWDYIVVVDELGSLFPEEEGKPGSVVMSGSSSYNESASIKRQEYDDLVNVIGKAYENMLMKFQSLNDELQNKVYGRIFKAEQYKKLYEISSGKLEPIENIYNTEKARQIYKQHKITRRAL